MIVEAVGDVPLHDDFCWLTLGQIGELLHLDNVVNMDSRTVLACAPFPDADHGALHADTDLLSWFTAERSGTTYAPNACPRPAARLAAERVDDRPRGGPVLPGRGGRRPGRQPGGRGLDPAACSSHWAWASRPSSPGASAVCPTSWCTPGSRAVSSTPWNSAPPSSTRRTTTPTWRRRTGPLPRPGAGRGPLPRPVRGRALGGGRPVPQRRKPLPPRRRRRAPGPARPTARLPLGDPGQLTSLVRHGHYLNVQARTLLACLNATGVRI